MKSLCIVPTLLLAMLAYGGEPPSYKTSEQAQAIFDALLVEADRAEVEVEMRVWSPSARRVEYRVIALDFARGEGAIRDLSRYVRLKMPKPVKEVVDGKEVWTIVYRNVDASEWFRFRIFKEDEAILEFLIIGDEYVACRSLLEDSVIEIDTTAVRPLIQSLREDMKRKSGEPGATDNPDDAQRSREDH